MELLNVLQEELKIGELVNKVRKHAIDAAVRKKEHDNETNVCAGGNEAVTQICRDFVILMAPIACDLSKLLWIEIG